MSLPFTTDQFMDVFVHYNEAIWPMQWLLNCAALLCAALLFVPSVWTSRVISLVLAGMWLWMALAYYLAFFAQLNPAAWWFGVLFLLGGMAFDWFGVVDDKLRFHPLRGAWQLIGAVLILLALVVYPIISYAVGRRIPPCQPSEYPVRRQFSRLECSFSPKRQHRGLLSRCPSYGRGSARWQLFGSASPRT